MLPFTTHYLPVNLSNNLCELPPTTAKEAAAPKITRLLTVLCELAAEASQTTRRITRDCLLHCNLGTVPITLRDEVEMPLYLILALGLITI